MASSTPNFNLKKIDIADSPPDITVTNGNWDTIDQELKKNADAVAAHSAETEIQVAGGTANAITVATGGVYSYSQRKRLSFLATATNTGNVTINVDNKGTVPALKFDGTQLAAGAIKAGKVYDWYYDAASGGRFFLIAKASGTAVTGDVLAGKPFSNDDGEFVGSMPNRGTFNLDPGANVPAGYYSGGVVPIGGMTTPSSIGTISNMLTNNLPIGANGQLTNIIYSGGLKKAVYDGNGTFLRYETLPEPVPMPFNIKVYPKHYILIHSTYNNMYDYNGNLLLSVTKLPSPFDYVQDLNKDGDQFSIRYGTYGGNMIQIHNSQGNLVFDIGASNLVKVDTSQTFFLLKKDLYFLYGRDNIDQPLYIFLLKKSGTWSFTKFIGSNSVTDMASRFMAILRSTFSD